ncbi:hypothetical protein [Methylosinus sp. Ce-a6]|uniref:hypothetical protein n=1 Tax=Methylosinus sp. Ce-a6 TaxID=2172005 RepID=UPI001357306E|nr:hypothetical protein [Methylosinus sp. Ce-a6]
MDYEALSNRSLLDATLWARQEWVTVGDNAHGGRVRAPFLDSVQGFQLVPGQMRPLDLYRAPSTNFDGFATRWEKRYSILVANRSTKMSIAPVVDQKPFYAYDHPVLNKFAAYPVVGHFGRVPVGNIIVRRKFATESDGERRTSDLQAILDQDIAYVEEDYPNAGDWGPFAKYHNVGPNYFELLIDPDGVILAIQGSGGSEPGLESEDPLSYVMAGYGLIKLATQGGRVVMKLLAKRAARKAAETAASNPAIARLMKTAVDLQGKNPVRTVELLTSSRVFRHTLTSELKGVAYARIEMEGSLRLSTGMAAHYGEGVYAWHAGASGVGTYIDIEIAAGAAVETLKVGAQSWVRIVPAQGSVLSVRIVGTNLATEAIEMGRKLVR